MSLRNEEKSASAVRLGRPSRVCLAIIGIASVTGILLLLLLYRRSDPPDLLLTTLAVGALVSFLFAVLGRLPSGFEVAGMKFNFSEDRLADLIGTVKSALDDDPKSRARILELIEEGTGAVSFKAAETRLAGPVEPESVGDQPTSSISVRPPEHPIDSGEATVSFEDRIDQRLKELANGGGVQKRFEVVRSGKGKAPIFDYFFERNGAGVVVELEQYWNPSTVDLISRKTDRALRKTTDVVAVIIVAPDAGIEAFSEAIEAPGALVVRWSELRDQGFGSRLDELVAAGQ